ncbi:hypothetical protein MKX03_001418 [Papaver bracteatum]|nr:hypothetical protein MKX03_001418 [Papaver bracteatum]
MSSKTSLLFLGFAAIFFTLLTLLCAQSDGNGVKTIWSTKIVTVENYIDPKIALKIHCRSSEDDFDEHTLYYKQVFFWKFKVNFWRTTKYKCDLSWYDPNAKKDHKKEFFAYKGWRDWMHNCENDCRWSFRQDGGYYGDGYLKIRFPFRKMFSYDE